VSGEQGRRDAKGRERGAARARGEGTRGALAPGERRKGTDPARTVAFDVLREVAESDAYANLVLPPMLRSRGLSGRDAAFATELTYGTLRLRGRYDAIIAECVDRPLDRIDAPVLDVLRLGAHQVLGMRVPAHAAVSETVGLARQRVGAGSAQFVNAVLRKITRTELEEWLEVVEGREDDEVARLSVVDSHPQWITRALRDALVAAGRPVDELESLLEADNASPRVTLVARPGLVSAEDLGARVASRPGRYAPTAVVLEGSDPGSLADVRDGRAGVQDEGSQLVTLAFVQAPVEGSDERWLDLCAGPGGKAALLAAIAGTRGARIVANEVQPHRADLVERSLAAVPEDSVEQVQVWDGRDVGTQEPGSYDRVLVDAPCTGLGALRRRPESRWRRVPADVPVLATLQRELLTSALAAVRPGGVVGYVTCSPHLAETRTVVSDVLRALPEGSVEILDARALVTQIAGTDMPLADRLDVQLWPHLHGTDAMHLTLLRRVTP
jgi:16S rRNA (cytosine967-C5)-methyltransferase